MKLKFSNVRSRELALKSGPRDGFDSSLQNKYQKLLESYDYKIAREVLQSWDLLDENMDYALSKTLFVLDRVLENEQSPNNVSSAVNTVAAALPKMRNAGELQYLIKRKISHVNTKIQTKQNNAVEDIKNVVSDKLNNIKAALPKSNPNSQPNPPEVAKEAYEKLNNVVTEMIHCDRVLNNYSKLCKRFNINKYITEAKSVDEIVSSITPLIDTYNIPQKIKYAVALETVSYAMFFNKMQYKPQYLVKCVSDYFLTTNSNFMEVPPDNGFEFIDSMQSILQTNPFFSEDDFTEIDYVLNPDVYRKHDSNRNTLDFSDGSQTIDNFTESCLSIIKESKESRISKILKELMVTKDKSVESIKKIMQPLYTESPDNIIEETPNMLQWGFGTILVVGSLAIHPVISMITVMTHAFLVQKLQRDRVRKAIEEYEKAKTKAEKKLEKNPDNENIKLYIDKLKKDISKLEDYESSLMTDKELEERNKDKDEFEFNESATIRALNEVSSFIDRHENKLQLGIDLRKIDSDSLYTMMEVCSKFKGVVDIDNLTESLDELANNPPSRTHAYFAKQYMRSLPKPVDTEYSIGDVFVANECFDILHNIEYDRPINEMKSLNVLTLQVERLKKMVGDLSDKEKIAARTIDMSIDNLHDNIERSMSRADREAVVRDKILPPFSKIIKTAILVGAAWVVSPAIAVIGFVASLVMSANYRAKERQVILDEIEIELDMVDRYIKTAEDKNDLKAIKNLLHIKKALEKQRARLIYSIKIEYNEKSLSKPRRNDDDD